MNSESRNRQKENMRVHIEMNKAKKADQMFDHLTVYCAKV